MLKKLFIIFFVSSAVWGNAIEGIKLPVAGSLFPLRIAIMMFAAILFYKTYAARENIIILQNSTLVTKQLRNVTAFCFVGMMLTGFITLYWAYDTSNVIVGLVTWLSSFACIFIALTFLKTQEDVILAARVFIINYLIIGGIGLYEAFTGDYYDMAYDYYARNKNIFGLYKPASIMFNINNLAIFMALSMPMCFIGTTGLKSKMLFDVLLIVFGSVIIIFTGCNTALILLCIILSMYLFMQKGKKSKYLIFASVVIVFVAFSSIVVNIFKEILTFSISEEPRIQIWINSVKVAWRYKFMGVGPGNSDIANNIYKANNVVKVLDPHNYFLEVFEDFGIFGFAFFVWWFKRIVSTFVKVHKNNKDSLSKYAIMFIVIFFPATLCMSSMIGYFYYWAELGILFSMMEIIESKDAPEKGFDRIVGFLGI